MLYSIYPALRTYKDVQQQSHSIVSDNYVKAFCHYYWNLLSDTNNAWGKENHVLSIARFNIIAESEYNDFDKAIELASKKNRQVAGEISSSLGLIFQRLGKLTTSLSYQKKSLAIREELGNRVGMAQDYTRIGNVLSNLGNYQEALEYHNKASAIDWRFRK